MSYERDRLRFNKERKERQRTYAVSAAMIENVQQRVARGARLLDKKVGPGWRKAMKKHEDAFNIDDTDCCVLGTLESHFSRLRTVGVAAVKRYDEAANYGTPFEKAKARLRIRVADEAAYGFNFADDPAIFNFDGDTWRERSAREQYLLEMFWQLEFNR